MINDRRNSFEKKHGFSIIDIIKIPGDIVQYDLFTSIQKNPIRIMNTPELISQRNLRARLIEETNFNMTTVNQEDWQSSKDFMVSVMRTLPVLDETFDFKNHIINYIGQSKEQSIEQAMENKKPFIINNHWHLCILNFIGWVKSQRAEAPSANDFVYKMTAMGCENVRLSINYKTLRAWKIPKEIIPDNQTKLTKNTVRLTAEIIIPDIPESFATMPNGDEIPIEVISEKGLNEIARLWSEQLISTAKIRLTAKEKKA